MEQSSMTFSLIITVKRGSACSLAEAWVRYASLDLARIGAAAVMRDERVQRVMVVRNAVPPTFVEWAGR
jgi:hypothetical protein